MFAVSMGSGEGGRGPATEVASALPAVEGGGCSGGEALEGAKCGEGGRNIVGRAECSDLNIRRYGEAASCPVFDVKLPRVRKSAKEGRTDEEVGCPSLSLDSRSLPEWTDVLGYLSGSLLVLLSLCIMELREVDPSNLGGASGPLSNSPSTVPWAVWDIYVVS
jgi:hypothetical protein